MQHHDQFLAEVTAALAAFEAQLIQQHEIVNKTAALLYAAGEPRLARHYLTYFSHTEAINALRLAQVLSDSLEARTKLLFGIDQSVRSGSPEVMW
ncbi:MAG: hypothetical protein R2911_05370 [Caldilineaceae bacterium]